MLRNFDRKPCRFAHVSSERDRNNPFENLVWHDNRTLLLALLRGAHEDTGSGYEQWIHTVTDTWCLRS